MLHKAKPEHAELVDRLVAELGSMQSDEMISWAKLFDIGGPDFDLQGRHNWLLRRAMKIVEKEQGVTFQNLAGEGYKRMPRALVNTVGIRARESIVRKAKRSKARILSVVSKRGNDMSDGDTKKAIAEMAGLGAIANVGGNRKAATQMRESMAEKADVAGPLPRFNVLKLFQKGKD